MPSSCALPPTRSSLASPTLIIAGLICFIRAVIGRYEHHLPYPAGSMLLKGETSNHSSSSLQGQIMIEGHKSLRFTWQSFGFWVGLTLLGFLLSIFFHFPAGGASETLDPQDINLGGAVAGFIFGAISGLIIASLQWIVLRAWMPGARLWIPLNALGYGLLHAFGDAIPYMSVVLVGGGIIIGAAQAIALRRELSNAILWVPVAAAAWYAGFKIGFAFPIAEGEYPLIVAALIYSAITGLAIKFMVLDRKSQPASQPNPTRNSQRVKSSNSQKVLLAGVFAVIAAVFLIFAGMMFGLF